MGFSSCFFRMGSSGVIVVGYRFLNVSIFIVFCQLCGRFFRCLVDGFNLVIRALRRGALKVVFFLFFVFIVLKEVIFSGRVTVEIIKRWLRRFRFIRIYCVLCILFDMFSVYDCVSSWIYMRLVIFRLIDVQFFRDSQYRI